MAFVYQLSELIERISPKPNTRYAKIVLDHNNIPGSPMSLGFFRFEPGQVGPKHAHDTEVEIYITIKGQGQVIVGDDVIEMRSGTIVYVPPQIEHETRNTGDTDLEFYGIFSPSLDLSSMRKWEQASKE
ncbi:cupin domain-containing protein [Desulfitibacter alkalitolerans]|uniref:cupin domain-containing protein n=1 Tax=Desulfitibacter alkalitolerans TaxID=264641 RepID=UPI0005517AE7|nr:dimethylsulfonioproprionate lyase family protein [Desulfitibacter alkalitolerans]